METKVIKRNEKNVRNNNKKNRIMIVRTHVHKEEIGIPESNPLIITNKKRRF